MKRSNSNPTTSLTKRRSFRGWLKRVTLPNGTQRRVGPDNMPKGGVFGIPLTMSIKYAKTTIGYIDEDNVKHTKAGAIPIVVGKCGSYLKKNGLETEGIFRVSGSIKRVNALEFQFDQSASSYGLDLNWEGYTVHDAASLLRRYLNKLPVPVIPFEYYQQFRDVMSNNPFRSTEQRIEAFQKLIQSLPPAHQHLLLYLLDTLSLFATTASETKMDIPNLAAVFCPGILRHPDHNSPIQYKISQYVIEFLIEFQSLFTMQLLVPTKRRNTAGSDVPPVPLLMASTANRISFSSASSSSSPSSPTALSPPPPPPPVPLHIVNPSTLNKSSSILSSLNSFIQSPQDIQTETIQTRNIKQNEQLGDRMIQFATPYYHLLTKKLTEFRQFIEPFIAKPAALLACVSVLLVTLCVIVYEVYLAVALVSFEPLVFFTGFASYWGILGHTILSMPIKENMTTRDIQPEEEEEEEAVVEELVVDEEEEDDELYTGIDEETEKAMLKDETIMSEWRDLLTRAWKTNEEGPTSSAASNFAADNDISSVMSRSSRFDEEENFSAPVEDNSSSDEDDDDLGFDPETLEAFLSQYDQIKKDAQLAKQLQIEEQKARDENNPFVVEKRTPLKIDSDIASSFDDDQVTTPTEKEAWKIRIFRD